ncbi:hypothetical protein THRCLA_01661 [Thraustotheca clavata]|uniref:Receptor expression-enhancing protein n=1 Tax=Thraustotheca clavata TaxID=74557 RepID=A0A1W0A8F4_9STRA|nr:hypothetical protein THRCLA_01661 [Thraustotheca clavata]
MTVMDKLREALDQIDFLEDAQERLGIEKEYLFLGGIALIWLVVINGVGMGFFAAILGFFYPGYASFRVLQKSVVVRKSETRLWLMYWIVFACFKVAEQLVFDRYLATIPMYPTLKCIVILAMFVPSTRRTCIFYNDYLVPYLKPNENAIDKLLREAKFEMDCVTSDVGKTQFFQAMTKFISKTKKN